LDEVLIDQARPDTAYIPVGDNNYGHPANDYNALQKVVQSKS
jgi:beta-lactamase superfamily II metal-dependent hydrolase